ncbi:MAG: hypothetical protein Q7S58_09875 [Candidatus Binatus sp.]|uniref:hypothetical protein n=1 Tax=Candidatus Binatus sp. TaxID=2811406 RepID=UPI00271D3460|nr:hypothetical protein [Candidatus Binatus sp.]MDO8432704.1 hypothetical protein [Candidatus Binatus sp.]
MPQQQMITMLFTIRLGVAEAAEDNSQFILSFDYLDPSRIVAFISPEIHQEMGKQFAQTPGLDGVSLSASLSSLIRDSCEYLENESAVNQLIASLESAVQQLRSFQNDRDAALRAAVCDRCSHLAFDHYRPDSGEIRCLHRDCECPEFAPLRRMGEPSRAGRETPVLRVSSSMRRPPPPRWPASGRIQTIGHTPSRIDARPSPVIEPAPKSPEK